MSIANALGTAAGHICVRRNEQGELRFRVVQGFQWIPDRVRHDEPLWIKPGVTMGASNGMTGSWIKPDTTGSIKSLFTNGQKIREQAGYVVTNDAPQGVVVDT